MKIQQNLLKECKQNYDKDFTKLWKQKMKLFEQDDTKNWKLPNEMEGMKESLLSNQTKAFQAMLPEETAILTAKKEEVDYFAKQLQMEVRRTVMMNYQENKDHFFEMSEIMSRCIYELNIGWTRFIQKYSPLNQEQLKTEKLFVEE